jgi:hypothetical protein
MNLCRSCGEDFASVSAFDAHRVGKHTYTYRDGRRFLHADELEANGYQKNEAGRWFHAAKAERAKDRFAMAPLA